MIKSIVTSLLFSLTLFFFWTTSIDAFYCGNEPIGRWDTKNKIIKYCGQPFKKGTRKVFYKGSYIYAETWFYNCGENDFIYAVSFYDNIVIKDDPIMRGSGVGQCK